MGIASFLSTLSLLLSSVACLGLMQSEGGLIDSCYSYSFVGVSTEHCRTIGANIVQTGEVEKGWYALVVSKARAENAFALGMGVGALYALLFLAKGTKEVVVVHLMIATWATSVCLVNTQNAALLPGVLAEANIDPASSSKLVPFVVITGVQAFLHLLSLLLSSRQEEKSSNSKDKVA